MVAVYPLALVNCPRLGLPTQRAKGYPTQERPCHGPACRHYASHQDCLKPAIVALLALLNRG
jgi:hypothetical protein